jgi:hypothetical protein
MQFLSTLTVYGTKKDANKITIFHLNGPRFRHPLHRIAGYQHHEHRDLCIQTQMQIQMLHISEERIDAL